MTELEKAARMALQALESMKTYAESAEPGLIVGVPAIDALRRALEQPAQTPIRCQHRLKNNGVCLHHNLHCGWPKCNEPEQPASCPRGMVDTCCEDYANCALEQPAYRAVKTWHECKPLYVAEQPAQQEPVAEKFEAMHKKGDVWITTIAAAQLVRNTRPQAREPLPAHEIVTMYDECPTGDSDMIAFARAIEAAHGIGETK